MSKNVKKSLTFSFLSLYFFLTGVTKYIVTLFIILMNPMIQFLKDSIRELKHVVWPTRKETQKYFGLVLLLLTLFWIYLFVFSNIFSTIVFGLKDLIRGESAAPSQSSSLSEEEIDALFSNEVDITTENSATDSDESQTQTLSGETLDALSASGEIN